VRKHEIMKASTIAAVLLVLLVSAATAIAAPTRITFSGRLTTSTGPVTGAVNLTFKLFDGATGGTEVWTETRNGIGAQDGLVFVELGETTTLDEAVFDGPRKFLEITVGTEILTPRLTINSVPYAISATSADTLGGSVGAGDVVTTVTPGAGIAATKTGNTLNVSLATTGCTTGEVWKFNGTTFSCEPDVDTTTTYTGGTGIAIAGTVVSLATTGCVAGEVWKYNGAAFSCEPDVDTDTPPMAGNGIAVAGNVVSLSTAGCVAGEVWKFNGSTFTCEPDANTTYSAGSGITISGTTIGLTNTCAVGQVLKANAGGTWSCANDVDTGFLAGNCTWARSTSTTAVAAVDALCPAGKYPISGGCDAAGAASVNYTRPFGPPADGSSINLSTDSWRCQFSAAAIGHVALALCCELD